MSIQFPITEINFSNESSTNQQTNKPKLPSFFSLFATVLADKTVEKIKEFLPDVPNDILKNIYKIGIEALEHLVTSSNKKQKLAELEAIPIDEKMAPHLPFPVFLRPQSRSIFFTVEIHPTEKGTDKEFHKGINITFPQGLDPTVSKTALLFSSFFFPVKDEPDPKKWENKLRQSIQERELFISMREKKEIANIQGWSLFPFPSQNPNQIKHVLMMDLYGKDLCEVLTMPNPLSLKNKLRIFLDVMRGVALLHKEQIIHRDLKLENILTNVTTENGESVIHGVLIDFGHSYNIKTHAKDWIGMGTVAYWCPEILKFFLDLRTSSQDDSTILVPGVDTWALGCIAAMLFFHSLPWSQALDTFISQHSNLEEIKAQLEELDELKLSTPIEEDIRKRKKEELTTYLDKCKTQHQKTIQEIMAVFNQMRLQKKPTDFIPYMIWSMLQPSENRGDLSMLLAEFEMFASSYGVK